MTTKLDECFSMSNQTHPKHERDDENDELDAPHAGIQVVGIRHDAARMFFFHVTPKKETFLLQL